MKITKLLTLILTVGAIIFITSCSKPDQHLRTIPSSAQIAGSANLLSITKKAELYDLDQYAFYNKMMQNLQSKNPDLHKFIQKIVSNPLQTGIRYREDLYFFTDNLNQKPFVGITMSLRNHQDFEEFLTQLLASTKKEMPIIKKEKFNYTTEEGMIIAYDNEKALMVVNDNSKKNDLINYSKTLMTQNSEASLTSHSDFSKFNKTEQDINVWLATDQLPKTPQAAMIQSQLPFSTKNNYLHSHIEFKNEGIFGTSQWSFNEDIQKLTDDYDFMQKEFNTELLDYLPKENYFSMGLAINPKAFYKYLNDIPAYKQTLDQASKSAPLNIEKILNSLDGDFMFAIHDIKAQTGNTNVLPLATFITGMNDKDIYKAITEQFIPKGLFQKKDNHYEGHLGGIDLYFGLFDGKLIATNDIQIIKGANNGGMKENLNSSPLKELFAHNSFLYTNMQWNQYPENLKAMAQSKMNPKENMAFESATNKLKEIKIYTKTIDKGYFEILTKNTDDNALHTMLKLLDNINMKVNEKEPSKNDIVAQKDESKKK